MKLSRTHTQDIRIPTAIPEDPFMIYDEEQFNNVEITLNNFFLGADLLLRFSSLVFANHSLAGPICELAAMGWAAAQFYGGREGPGRNLAFKRPQTIMEP
jgi:hypothetical protein